MDEEHREPGKAIKSFIEEKLRQGLDYLTLKIDEEKFDNPMEERREIIKNFIRRQWRCGMGEGISLTAMMGGGIDYFSNSKFDHPLLLGASLLAGVGIKVYYDWKATHEFLHYGQATELKSILDNRAKELEEKLFPGGMGEM